mmetsp:Transcript_7335/g.17361  ORF Transcript_7335/g.17361 Transcript_7335/m.17361 type:complete len:162 (+) Transcript_7335:1413-1898(+)
MRFYMSLLIKLRQYALQCEGGWDQWKVHRTFHANKLISIRTLSNTRTNCMLRVYIYLRDQEKKGFLSEKLQVKINEAIYEQSRKKPMEFEAASAGQGDQTRHSCSHCQSNLHNGGKTQCLFKDLSAIKARSHAREADQQLRANPGQCLNDIVKALLSPFNN